MGAKKRNHYIPKFLLKRFAAEEPSSSPRVWQYRSGSHPKLVGVAHAGVSSYFYGEPDNGVEDDLSRVESTQSPVLDSILKGDDPQAFEPVLAEFAWYMSYRTANIRSSFGASVEHGINGLVESASSDDAREAMGRHLDAELDRLVERLLTDSALPPETAVVFRSLYPNLRPTILEQIRSEIANTDMSAYFANFFQMMSEQAPVTNALQTGHVNAMSRALTGEHELTRFSGAMWRCVEFDSNDLVLGDGVVIARNRAGESAHPLRYGADWYTLWIPISPSRLLIASREAADNPDLSPELVNECSASLATQCFFASQSTPNEDHLATQIGIRQPGITTGEVDEIVRETWGDW